jgi:uncharacterized protein (TIGR00255 family)
MNSMTGFGSASRRSRGLDLEVEIRSVNHRFLSLKQNLPEGFGRVEGEIESLVRARIGRGSVTVSVSVKAASGPGAPLPDLATLRATARRLREIGRALGLKGELTFSDLLSIPSLWEESRTDGPAAELWPRVRPLVARAVDRLAASRAREGAKIARDLQARLAAIEERLDRIEERAPEVVASYERKLEERIGTLLSQKGIDGARADVLKEVALHADRVDISEEIQRLRAHIGEFRKILGLKGQVGRRLDFLTQEMGRETNTILSKGNDTRISALGVEIKTELEKIKEQVENVE